MAGEPGASVKYYARLRPGDDPRQPEGILRVIKGPALLREEEFARSGDWAPTGFFRGPVPALDGTLAVEVDAEAAAVVIFGWRQDGMVAFVEGAGIPPLPRTPGPPPSLGAGPVTPQMAQAIADAWAGPDGSRGGVYEFDLGYVVYSRTPAGPVDTTRPPSSLGAGRGVIDKATGELSVWPTLPFDQVAALYREQDTRRGRG